MLWHTILTHEQTYYDLTYLSHVCYFYMGRTKIMMHPLHNAGVAYENPSFLGGLEDTIVVIDNPTWVVTSSTGCHMIRWHIISCGHESSHHVTLANRTDSSLFWCSLCSFAPFDSLIFYWSILIQTYTLKCLAWAHTHTNGFKMCGRTINDDQSEVVSAPSFECTQITAVVLHHGYQPWTTCGDLPNHQNVFESWKKKQTIVLTGVLTRFLTSVLTYAPAVECICCINSHHKSWRNETKTDMHYDIIWHF